MSHADANVADLLGQERERPLLVLNHIEDYEATSALLSGLSTVSLKDDEVLYIVSYSKLGDPPGAAVRKGARVRNFLLGYEKLKTQKDKVIVIEGKHRYRASIEVWITRNPPPRVAEFRVADSRVKRVFFDEYYHAFTGENSWVLEEDQSARLDYYGSLLEAHKNWKGIIKAYSVPRGKRINGVEYYSATELAMMEKEYLVTRFEIAPERLQITDGGVRDRQAIQLWIQNFGHAVSKKVT